MTLNVFRAWLWHEFCQDPALVPSYKRYVCDKHFSDSDFVKPDLLELKNTAIPSVNRPNWTNFMDAHDQNAGEKTTNMSTCKPQSLNSDSGYLILDTIYKKSEDSSQPSQLNYIDHCNVTNSTKSKLVNTPDMPNIVLETSSNILKCPGSIIKSYKRIDSGLKLSLMKSIAPTLTVKQNASSSSDQRPFKIYKSTQKNLEVNLQPQIVYPDDEIEKEPTESDERYEIVTISQKPNILVKNCTFNNRDITLKSTLVFEYENKGFTPNLMVEPNLFESELSVPNSTGSNSQVKNSLSENFSSKSSHPSSSLRNKIKQNNSKPHLVSSFSEKIFLQKHLDQIKIVHRNKMLKKTKQNNSKANLVSPHTAMRSSSLQKQLDQIKTVHREKMLRYRRKVLNKKSFPSKLDVNDPKYSIAAIAESVGTFNSFVEEPVESVDLEAGEWCKLYEPSETTFPNLAETQIGPMVNHLRSKLPTLNERDKLEVSFLLSMMSVYPSAPKHIKELLCQRLNLVYIATMFKWDTALALGLKVYKNPTTSKALSSERNSTTSKFRCKTFQKQTNILASFNSNVDSFKNDCTNTNGLLGVTRKNNLSKPVKRPQFAFEIIVQEKSVKSKQDESCNTTKEL